jgi:hypothetical protein
MKRPKRKAGGNFVGDDEVADIDTNTALIIAAISAISAIIGASIGSATNYLIEWQRNRNEEKRRQQEEEAKRLNLRYQAYMEFLSIQERELTATDSSGDDYFEPDQIVEKSASVITYGSPKVSSLLARSFPLKSWESIEKTKRMIISELVKEKGGKLLISASIEAKELDAYMGIKDGLKENGKG